ncbi:MAG: M1 family metallopeptidase [Crocinitomicaceae bacterium]|nr:M1 family metallopeptidase [Crocinitomicaceae bacterium]
MKFSIFFLLFLPFISTGQDYFQQEVNYTIDVRLDDKTHELFGKEEFEYINNSPDNLDKIMIHLWPNAYSDGHTALANQQYAQNDEDLRLGSDSMKGYIDSLDFRINGSPVKWSFDEEHPDICTIHLPVPLKPGEHISISTPFHVKIPSGRISRLGHIGQSYQITQWYPKPAVYDKDGWHAMPYLNQGEFYSEYGSFDVRITLPENYVVGATGDLQTESEIEFMNARAEKTATDLSSDKGRSTNNDFPESSSQSKTIRFTQKNVHDFAWFADKRYWVLKGNVELPHSKRNVTSWALFTPNNWKLWQNAIEYINDGTYFYSKWNGDYPYNNVTAVDGTISAGGGMEYPNVTVIGNSGNAMTLEIVIVHEVGHNWFYGQLGSNERDHGWMDEGMNTLNEMRYIQTKYPDNTNLSDMLLGGRMHLDDLDHHDSGDLSYRVFAWLGEDQPVETKSAEFSPANYGIVMYQKTGLLFFYLKDYLGEELFDKCAMEYYRAWEFKHPSPSDMRASYEKTSGKDLGWLFDDLINTTHHLDYKLVRAKKTDDGLKVKVRNVGQVDGPIEVNLVKDGEVVGTQWAEPGTKTSEVLFVGEQDFDQIVIDYTKDIPEMRRSNNTLKAKGILKKIEKPKVEFLTGDNEPDRTNIFWTPVIAGNAYDKLMLGAAIHNYGVVPSKWNYFVAPMYSFGRNSVSGIAEFSHVSQPKRLFKQSRIGLSLKSFKLNESFAVSGRPSNFYSISPSWKVNLGSRDKKAVNYKQSLLIQGVYREDRIDNFNLQHAGAFVQYDFNFKLPDHVVNVRLRNDYFSNVRISQGMARARVSAEYKFRYLRRKQERWIELRGFYGNQYYRDYSTAGAAPGRFGGYQWAMSLAGTDGQQDLFTEEYYFGRNEISGIWSQQRSENMGGFRSTSYYGTTDHWMLTGNMWVQLPYIPKLFGAFVDAGVFSNGISESTAVNMGLGMRFGNTFGLYFPIWMSQELSDSFGNSSYAEKIRFTLNLNIANKSGSIINLIN